MEISTPTTVGVGVMGQAFNNATPDVGRPAVGENSGTGRKALNEAPSR